MFKKLIDLFFPKICCGCKEVLLQHENVICTWCRHEIPLTEFYRNPDNEAAKKFYGRLPVEHASAFMYFNKKGIVQEIIHSLKYRGHEEIGTVIGKWYAEDLKSIALDQTIDCIIPVPLHKKRLRQRGFNQVTAFGKALSETLQVHYDPGLLLRKIYSETQSRKNRQQRAYGSETIFDVVFTDEHHGKHFLLIDDVLTTGATLESCGKAILKIPGAKLSVVTMAMSHS
ncbi:amidophosphoribosyltransferase [Flavobacterium magnum]|uniref:Amidophosphoribosyltransferase n=1 Tax=Flavobacterium magnum TaxID=2162713 RepID=A0A2S0RDH3_9FLAO|nr:ComF family protein [Flavobacterium magnum]AWA29340.1 amidophosphoribosyltransferase [Flavobacterium magnum]